jgi:hypothetical protein
MILIRPIRLQCNTLPSLNAGQWRRSSGYIRDAPTLTVYRVRWDFAHAALYPFFFRSHDASIFYPQRGEGWYWAPEVDAAREAIRSGALRGRCTVLDAWSWEPVDPDARPFGFIASLYAQRQQWKRDKIGAEKVLKLGINSLYGKTAQHVGGRDGAPPRYHQLEYAGWITSYTRAALFRAAIPTLARRSAIMLSTDAIYSLEPLPDLPTGPNSASGAPSRMTGYAWSSRGSIGRGMTPSGKRFRVGSTKGQSLSMPSCSLETGAQSYDATLSRFVTMGSALQAREDSPGFKAWRTWRTTPRALALCPRTRSALTTRARAPRMRRAAGDAHTRRSPRRI